MVSEGLFNFSSFSFPKINDKHSGVVNYRLHFAMVSFRVIDKGHLRIRKTLES